MNKGQNSLSMLLIIITLILVYGASLLTRGLAAWIIISISLAISLLSPIIGGLPVLIGGLVTSDKKFVFEWSVNYSIIANLGLMIYSWFSKEFSIWQIISYNILILAINGAIYRTINNMKKEVMLDNFH